MFILSSCNPNIERITGKKVSDRLDRKLDLDYKDFEAGLLPKTEELSQKLERQRNHTPAIPKISNAISIPQKPVIAEDKLVSISVTEDVPVKDVLIELARLADVSMEIDSGISGGIILRVKDKPFSDVIERVVNLAGLRYTSTKGIIRVERDLAYAKNYVVDILNLTRSNSSTVSVSTRVLGGTASSGGSSDSSSGATSSSSGSDLSLIHI